MIISNSLQVSQVLELLNRGGLFEDGRPSIYEQEVRISDKIPLSYKADSIRGEDDMTPNDNIRRDLPLKQLKSTPINDPPIIEDNTYPEEFKSDAQEVEESTGLPTKKTGSKKKGGKNKKADNGKLNLYS